MADILLDRFEEIIGYRFKNRDLLLEALTHRSFAHEARDKDVKDNQRLEFLGDAVLGLLTAEILYHKHPDYNEGELTKLRSHLVNTFVLSRQAKRIHLGDYLRLGKGEKATGGQTQRSNLAAAFEAVVAAIYIDGGLTQVRQFVLERLEEEIELVQQDRSTKDYKSLLQELTMKRWKVIPTYHIVSSQGPDHARIFKIVVKIKDRVYGQGQGTRRKLAEQSAAAMALEKLGEIEDGGR